MTFNSKYVIIIKQIYSSLSSCGPEVCDPIFQDPAASSTSEAETDPKGESVALNYKPSPLQVQIGIRNSRQHDTHAHIRLISWKAVNKTWEVKR